MSVETDELVFVVDETHEDLPCFTRTWGCRGRMQAVRFVLTACGCVKPTCIRDAEFLLSGGDPCLPVWRCDICQATYPKPGIIRTWPVTR